MKYCPNCGAGVEPGVASCESCGTELSAVQTAAVASSDSRSDVSIPDAARTVADLTPRQLRREIRWGVFQGILLVAVIGLVVYLVIVLLVLGAVFSSGSIAGS